MPSFTICLHVMGRTKRAFFCPIRAFEVAVSSFNDEIRRQADITRHISGLELDLSLVDAHSRFDAPAQTMRIKNLESIGARPQSFGSDCTFVGNTGLHLTTQCQYPRLVMRKLKVPVVNSPCSAYTIG